MFHWTDSRLRLGLSRTARNGRDTTIVWEPEWRAATIVAAYFNGFERVYDIAWHAGTAHERGFSNKGKRIQELRRTWGHPWKVSTATGASTATAQPEPALKPESSGSASESVSDGEEELALSSTDSDLDEWDAAHDARHDRNNVRIERKRARELRRQRSESKARSVPVSAAASDPVGPECPRASSSRGASERRPSPAEGTDAGAGGANPYQIVGDPGLVNKAAQGTFMRVVFGARAARGGVAHGGLGGRVKPSRHKHVRRCILTTGTHTLGAARPTIAGEGLREERA